MTQKTADPNTATLIDLGGVPITDLLTLDDTVLMDVIRRLTENDDDTEPVSAFSSAM